MSSTPYGIVSAATRTRVAAKAELVRVSRRLERRALEDPPETVAATLQDARYLTPHTRAVYCCLARSGAAATLYARGLQSWIATGVTGIALDDDDPLVDEWVVVLPSPSTPVVFAATDLRDEPSDDAMRSFSYAVSQDPEVVAACARLLVPAGRNRPAPAGH